MDTGTPYNPFSSHHLEPNRGGYIFPEGQTLSNTLAALRATGWRGELSGPHGAGKSTLLADICTHLRHTGHTVIWWQSSDRRRLPPRAWLADIRRADVIAYDGAERLLTGLLPLLRLITRAFGRGFIITTHWRHGYGAYIPIRPNAHSLAKKFNVKQAGGYSPSAWEEKIEAALIRHNGNSRQVLFDLYLEYEDTARAASQHRQKETPADSRHVSNS